MDSPTIYVPSPHSSNPNQHFPELCTVCAARLRRHQANNNVATARLPANSAPPVYNNAETQLTPSESTLDPPPPYSKRRRYQRLEADPPTYANVIMSPPPGVVVVAVPVTIRYTQILILEDDGYSKVVCPTARKFKTHVNIYASMDWSRFWACLRQLKPTITTKEDSLKDVRGFRRRGKWERFMCVRFNCAHLEKESWEETREEICNGEIDKIVISAV